MEAVNLMTIEVIDGFFSSQEPSPQKQKKIIWLKDNVIQDNYLQFCSFRHHLDTPVLETDDDQQEDEVSESVLNYNQNLIDSQLNYEKHKLNRLAKRQNHSNPANSKSTEKYQYLINFSN